jgi:quercetin dioxygenase-like cupin family protein
MADTSFRPLKREPVLEEPSANPTVRLIKGARIKFAPGQPTGLHRHPVSTVGVVTAGSFNFHPEGGPPRLLRTGDGFFEPAGRTILRFDNASACEPAEIVCFYLADTKERPAIEMLAGGMDSQLGRKNSSPKWRYRSRSWRDMGVIAASAGSCRVIS